MSLFCVHFYIPSSLKECVIDCQQQGSFQPKADTCEGWISLKNLLYVCFLLKPKKQLSLFHQYSNLTSLNEYRVFKCYFFFLRWTHYS